MMTKINKYYCGDCIRFPKTFNKLRKCTYMYYALDGLLTKEFASDYVTIIFQIYDLFIIY